MRRNKGMSLVELMVSMLISLILGGVVVLFLHFGLEMELFNAVNALNQQSLRTPFLELTPLVERAAALEILTALPPSDSLNAGEVVLHVADPANSNQALPGGANNLYFRTRSGDRMISGFSNIVSIDFSLVSALSRDKDVVRVTLTAQNAGKELVYSTDVRPLNRSFSSPFSSVSVSSKDKKPKKSILSEKGLNSGAYLKISSKIKTDLHVFVATASQDTPSSFSLSFDRTLGDKTPSSEGCMPLSADVNVVGLFYVLAGSPSPRFECEWRLYGSDDAVDKMEDYKVIGRDVFTSAYYQERYKDRFKKVYAYDYKGSNRLDAAISGLRKRYKELYGGDLSGNVNMHVGATMASNSTASNSTEHFSIKKSTLGEADVLKLDGLMGLMAGKFLAFAVRPEGDENWTQSKGFEITR